MDSLEISNMQYAECVNSRFVVPARVTFEQNGRKRKWDYVKVHDAVLILIYNKSRDAFVLVKQFRPAVYVNFNASALKEEVTDVSTESIRKDLKVVAPYERGVTYELCAGIIDQKRKNIEIAQSEIEEETGYMVPLESIEKVMVHHNVGFSGNRLEIYFTEVTDGMKNAKGGGIENSGEFIDLHYLPRDKVREFLYSEEYVKPAICSAALMWYLLEKNK